MNMDLLKSLARAIHQQQIDVVGKKKDKADELLKHVLKNTQEDALSEILYPGKKHSRIYFNQLKRGLKDRLINSLFATSPKKKNYWDIYFDIEKRGLTADYLWNKEQSQAAAQLAKETLKLAIKYECTKVCHSLSSKLAGHYAFVVSEPAKYRKYKELSEEFQKRMIWESKAEAYYFELSHYLRKAKTISNELFKKAQEYRDELTQAPLGISWNYQFISALISILLEKIRNNGEAVIATCEKSLSYFESLPFDVPNRPIRSITFNVIPAYLQTGNITKAENAINVVKGMVKRSGYNWIAIHQYEAILGFHKMELRQAEEAIAEIKKSRLSSRIREEIRIYETYVKFLQGEKLRLGTFLNSTPKYSLDKKGMNINRVILRNLILISRNDRAAIIDQSEALEQYAYRYLKNDKTLRRPELFIRLLFLIVRHSFDKKEVEKHAIKTLKTLSETPMHISTIDIEIVPYQVLWQKIISNLS